MTAPMVDYKIHWLKMMSVPESRAVVGRHDGINGRDRDKKRVSNLSVISIVICDSEGVEIEMREVYSTPFVFLTDTFTGKSLCFCDLDRGHPFRNEVSQLPSFFTSIGPSKICPHMGIDFVLYHPSS